MVCSGLFLSSYPAWNRRANMGLRVKCACVQILVLIFPTTHVACLTIETYSQAIETYSSLLCTGMTQGDGGEGRWEGGSGWGTRVHLWRIHADVWQNQYNI